MKTLLSILLVTCALFAFGSSAHANTNFPMWQSPATACVPVTAAFGTYTTGGDSLTTNSNTYATLFCAIPTPLDSSGCTAAAWTLTTAFSNSSLSWGSVQPQLIEVNRLNNTQTVIAGGVNLMNRSSYYVDQTQSFTHTMDFQNNVYYVQVQLSGTTPLHPTSQTLYWVSIDCQI